MADSILNMNQSLKRLHPSNTDDQLDSEQRKYSAKDVMSASDGSDEDGHDSDAELRAFVALKPIKLPKINHVLDSSKPTAAMTHCCRKSQKIFSMQTNHVRLSRNNWLTLLTTCGLKNCPTQNLRISRRNIYARRTARLSRHPEIWNKLSHSVKQQDLRSSSTQKTVGTAGAVLCKSIEMLLEMKNSKQPKSDSDIQQLLKLNTDAVALLGHAHVDLSHRRRESIKPHLNEESVCSFVFAIIMNFKRRDRPLWNYARN